MEIYNRKRNERTNNQEQNCCLWTPVFPCMRLTELQMWEPASNSAYEFQPPTTTTAIIHFILLLSRSVICWWQNLKIYERNIYIRQNSLQIRTQHFEYILVILVKLEALYAFSERILCFDSLMVYDVIV